MNMEQPDPKGLFVPLKGKARSAPANQSVIAQLSSRPAPVPSLPTVQTPSPAEPPVAPPDPVSQLVALSQSGEIKKLRAMKEAQANAADPVQQLVDLSQNGTLAKMRLGWEDQQYEQAVASWQKAEDSPFRTMGSGGIAGGLSKPMPEAPTRAPEQIAADWQKGVQHLRGTELGSILNQIETGRLTPEQEGLITQHIEPQLNTDTRKQLQTARLTRDGLQALNETALAEEQQAQSFEKESLFMNPYQLAGDERLGQQTQRSSVFGRNVVKGLTMNYAFSPDEERLNSDDPAIVADERARRLFYKQQETEYPVTAFAGNILGAAPHFAVGGIGLRGARVGAAKLGLMSTKGEIAASTIARNNAIIANRGAATTTAGSVAMGAGEGLVYDLASRPEGSEEMDLMENLQARAQQAGLGVALGSMMELGLLKAGDAWRWAQDKRFEKELLKESKAAGYGSDTKAYLMDMLNIQRTDDGRLVAGLKREPVSDLPELEPTHEPPSTRAEQDRAETISLDTGLTRPDTGQPPESPGSGPITPPDLTTITEPPARPGTGEAEAVVPGSSQPTVSPATERATTLRGTSVDVDFQLVDADSLTTSHLVNGVVNPDYPAELQPRDRSRVGSEAQVLEIANDLRPDWLGRSPKASDGAPIIGDDGLVESGNGRVSAIRHAYASGKADNYRQWLKDNASQFGLDPASIDGMSKPVLVRRRTTPMDMEQRAAFTREANESDVARMSASEQAKVDSGRLTDDDVMMFAPDDSGDISADSNSSFLRRFMERVGITDGASIVDRQGRPNQAFVQRVRSAIFKKAYDDDRLLSLMAETTDADLKGEAARNMVSALTRAAPAFARARAMGDIPAESDFIPNLLEAVDLVRRSRRDNQSLSELISQGSLLEPVDPITEQLAMFFDANLRSSQRMGEVLKDLGQQLENEVARGGNDLFGSAPASKADFIASTNRNMEARGEHTGPIIPERPAAGEIPTSTGPKPEVQRETETGSQPGEPAGAGRAAVDNAGSGKVDEKPSQPSLKSEGVSKGKTAEIEAQEPEVIYERSAQRVIDFIRDTVNGKYADYDKYGGTSLGPAKRYYVEELIKHRRNLTPDEHQAIADKFGLPKNLIDQFESNGGYGFGSIQNRAYFGSNPDGKEAAQAFLRGDDLKPPSLKSEPVSKGKTTEINVETPDGNKKITVKKNDDGSITADGQKIPKGGSYVPNTHKGQSTEASLNAGTLHSNPINFAIRQMAQSMNLGETVASSFGGGVYGATFSDEDIGSEKWWLDVMGGAGMAAFGFGTSRYLGIHGKDSFLGKTYEYLGKQWNEKMPWLGKGSKEIRDLKKQQQLMRQIINRQTGQMGEFLAKNFTPGERSEMADIIENRGYPKQANLVARQAQELDDFITYTADRMKELGMLPPDMDTGAYLHRYYAKHLKVGMEENIKGVFKQAKKTLSGSYTIPRGTDETFKPEYLSPAVKQQMAEYDRIRDRIKELKDTEGDMLFAQTSDELNDLTTQLKALQNIQLKEYVGIQNGKPHAFIFMPDEVPKVPGLEPFAGSNTPPVQPEEAGRVWSLRGSVGDQPVLWRDWTKTEREGWGEITDAGYRFVRGQAEVAHDLSMATMFHKISGRSDWVSDTPVSLKGKDWHQVPTTKINNSQMHTYGKLAGKYVNPDVWRALKHYNQPLFGRGRAATIYRKMLDKWKVWKTVYNPVSHYNNTVSNLEMYYMAGYSARSLGSSIRELSRGENSDYFREARDIGMFGTDFLGSLTEGGDKANSLAELAEMLRNQPDIADANQVNDSLSAVTRFKTWLIENKELVMNADSKLGAGVAVAKAGASAAKAITSPVLSAVNKPVKAYTEGAKWLYQKEDELFKLAVFIEERKKGLSPFDAMEVASRFFFDYSDLPDAVRKVKDFPIGSPFISYTYLALPAIIRNAVERPERMLALAAAYEGLNYASLALDGQLMEQGYWERREADETLNPSWLKGRSMWGALNVIDVSGFMPGLDTYKLSLANAHAMGTIFGGESGKDLPLWPGFMGFWGPDPIGGNPVTRIPFDIFFNQDWKGDPLYSKNDKYEKSLKYAYQAIFPSTPVFPFSWHQNKVLEGMAGDINIAEEAGQPANQLAEGIVTAANSMSEAIGGEQFTGADWKGNQFKTTDSLISALGPKLSVYRPKDIYSMQSNKINKKIDDERREHKRKMRGNYTKSQKDKYQSDYKTRMADYTEEKEKLKAAYDSIR